MAEKAPQASKDDCVGTNKHGVSSLSASTAVEWAGQELELKLILYLAREYLERD